MELKGKPSNWTGQKRDKFKRPIILNFLTWHFSPTGNFQAWQSFSKTWINISILEMKQQWVDTNMKAIVQYFPEVRCGTVHYAVQGSLGFNLGF